MNKEKIMKLLQSPNTEDFELGLNYAYKTMDRSQFENTMDILYRALWLHDRRQEVFQAYGQVYKRAGDGVFPSQQSIEESVGIGYREIKLEQ